MAVRQPIPYGKQNITQNDIDAVTEVLTSDYLTQGPRIEQFEKSFSDYIGSEYAVAVSNGTAALHLCALALGVNEQSKVITSPITFSASANCVRYCGGEVVFADIDPETYLLDIQAVEKILSEAPQGTYQGIIPVDFAGRAVDMEAFRELSGRYGLWIIEDACHAPGGSFTDSKNLQQFCGNGSYADLAIFSFHPVKHIAAGEGGMITTNSEELYQKLLNLRTHGITKNADEFQNSVDLAIGNALDSSLNTHNYPNWYMEMQELGYNYRLTDFQAALGMSQLKRADGGIERRREIASRYESAFEGSEFVKGQSGTVDGHAYHLYVIEVDDRKGLYEELRKHQIYAQIHYIPVHLMPYYKQFGWKAGDFPHAESYYSSCISLPMYPTLSDEEQQIVIDTVKNYYA